MPVPTFINVLRSVKGAFGDDIRCLEARTQNEMHRRTRHKGRRKWIPKRRPIVKLCSAMSSSVIVASSRRARPRLALGCCALGCMGIGSDIMCKEMLAIVYEADLNL